MFSSVEKLRAHELAPVCDPDVKALCQVWSPRAGCRPFDPRRLPSAAYRSSSVFRRIVYSDSGLSAWRSRKSTPAATDADAGPGAGRRARSRALRAIANGRKGAAAAQVTMMASTWQRRVGQRSRRHRFPPSSNRQPNTPTDAFAATCALQLPFLV